MMKKNNKPTLKEVTKTRYHKKFNYYTNDSIIGRSLRLYGEYGQSEIDFLLSICSVYKALSHLYKSIIVEFIAL